MLANTKKQKLSHHSFAIGYLSKIIFEHVVSKEALEACLSDLDLTDPNFEYQKLSYVMFNMGLFHDIGKVDENFQNFINKNLNKEIASYEVQITDKKFSFEDYPRHQEISWALLSVFKTNNYYNMIHKELCEYGVYWHHAKILRKKNLFSKNIDILENKDINFENIKINCQNFIKDIAQLLINFNLSIPLIVSSAEECSTEKSIPLFQKENIFEGINSSLLKDRASLFKNSLNHLMRSILITADRIISSISSKDLEEYINNKDLDVLMVNIDQEDNNEVTLGIKNMLDQFNIKYPNSERNKKQNNCATDLANVDDICILSGPAGVGKTKIMLEWVNKKDKNKKIYIIAPKTSICFSLYEELKENYLPDNSIQLLTGENKFFYQNNIEEELTEKAYFECDIVVTTIDQILMLMLSHKKIDVFLDVLNSTLIFDEYHEYLDQSAILILFIQIIQLKKIFNNKDCLLVSATPNYFLVHDLLGIKIKNHIVKIDSFNQKDYNLDIKYFDDKNASELDYDMYNNYNTDTLLIFNTAQKSQYSAILANKKQENNTLVYNSKLLPNQRSLVFKKIKKEFGKITPTKNYVVRSGPILQASVDISTNNMLTEISTIDNIYQRMGRLNRWGQEENAQYTIFIPNDLSDLSSKNASIKLALGQNLNSTIAFKEFLSKQTTLKKFQLKHFYSLYEDFFGQESTKTAYSKDWKLIKEEAKKIFSNGFEPIQYTKVLISNDVKVISKNSLRGNSIFAYVANLDYKNNKEQKDFSTDFKNQIVSIKKEIYPSIIETNVLLEESRKQINNHSDTITQYIYDNLNEKTNLAKNVSKNVSKIPVNLLLDFARTELTPIILSYKKILNKNMLEDNEFYNITYNNISLGIMKQSQFRKMK